MGHAASGAFGYSHLTGGFAGGQAEFARVPFADVGPLKIENGLSDEQVLFLSDILPTGYMGAEMCDITAGRHGRGLGLRPGRPVRHQERVPARRRAGDRDRPLRLSAARWRATSAAPRRSTTKRSTASAETLIEMTAGRGPDACIDAVGLEAHGHGLEYLYDRDQAGADAGNGPADRAARSDHGVPQRRHGLGHRRLRRPRRQVPARHDHESRR